MSGKPEFFPDMQSEEADRAIAHTCEGFDYDALDRALGTVEPLGDAGREEAIHFVRALMGWLVEPIFHRRTKVPKGLIEKLIARRLIALAWVANPAWFEDGPSMTQLARELKISKPTMSVIACEVTRRFGLKNHGQDHGDGVRKREALKLRTVEEIEAGKGAGNV